MHDITSKIEGLPIQEIRQICKIGQTRFLNKAAIKRIFKTSNTEIKTLIEILVQEGYLEKVEELNLWRTSRRGDVLANTTLPRPILRTNAEKMIQMFLERVNQVNNESYFLYKVVEVQVYGDYLNFSLDTIESIKLAVNLEPKESDYKKHRTLLEERRRNAKRRFSDYINNLYYPRQEVFEYLKSRVHHLEIHNLGDTRAQRRFQDVVKVYPA